MKRILVLFVVLVLVVSSAGCQRREDTIKYDIFHLVEKNYDAIVAACENKDTDVLYAIDGIKKVDIVDGYVLFFCEGNGIAPSSRDYGFYYSEENQPVAVFDGKVLCKTSELVEEGNGYQYISHGNVFFTEQIKGKIYFYSASF